MQDCIIHSVYLERQPRAPQEYQREKGAVEQEEYLANHPTYWGRLNSMTRMVRKADGSIVRAIVRAMRNPDGSWFEMPEPKEQASGNESANEIDSPAEHPPTLLDVREFLREIGRKGGRVRASRHRREELAAWGRMRLQTKLEGPPQ
jgi:hypothetical protein